MGKEDVSNQSHLGTDVIPEKVSVYDTTNSTAKKKSLFEKLGLVEAVDQTDEEKSETPQNNKQHEESNNSNVVSMPENKLLKPEQKNKAEKLSIDEIYTIYSLSPRTATNTVYLIDHFLKALPANLPIEIKKQSLNSLLEASHIDLSDLLNDGRDRSDLLNQYLENFTMDLEDIISENKKAIEALKEKIAYHSSVIEERSRTLDEQKSIVKFEIQKISSIVDFVKSKDA